MSDIPFYTTVMGHRFYESTMPNLVRELGRLNANLERVIALIERSWGGMAPPQNSTPVPPPEGLR